MITPSRLRRAGLVPALAAALLFGGAAVADAHIQISPTVAAPDDAVHFTVLVPGEREQETVKVALKVPKDVLPFSYAVTPGWKRTLIQAPNGAVDQIVWTGRMAKDGFAEFSFLAGTPERPTTLTWKALQTYSDGTVVRWIGAPGSEEPAPTTQIERGLPTQNAGGEGDPVAAGTKTTTTPGPSSAARPASSADDVDWVARGLALAGVFVGLAALVLLLRRSKNGGRP